ncbi:hypothetical protein ACFFIX_09765 [Metabacillus herbersteinensis]|uniref:Uncharacterized protein n=1 Tax=Metabacillus herbersteinensis TaxID=283816 RepID=A0ABV6GDI4_9BACI
MNKAQVIKTLTKCKRILEAVDKKHMEKDILVLEEVMLAIKGDFLSGKEVPIKNNSKIEFSGEEYLKDIQNKVLPVEIIKKYKFKLPTKMLKSNEELISSWKDLTKTEKNKFTLKDLRAIYIYLNNSATYKTSWTKKAIMEEIDSSVASLLRSERLSKVN